MKKYLVLFIILLVIIVVACICIFSEKKGAISTNLEYMRFSYTTGSMMDANVRYEINYKDGKYIATIKPNLVSEENKKEIEISKDTLKKIVKILNKNDVSSWDGFNSADQRVLDGDSFSFNLKTLDGKTISALAYMKWPKNYNNVSSDLNVIFMDLYNSN